MADISVTYIDHMGSDLSVVNAARVSFNKESDWVDTAICPFCNRNWVEMDDPYEMTCRGCGDEIGDIRFRENLSERDAKLISYLAKHNHKSPFNHVFASFRVKAPIFVARQLVKHEYMPWNEVSRRYVDSEPEFYTPETWRKKADNVKQGSSDEPVGVIRSSSGWSKEWPTEDSANCPIEKHVRDFGWEEVETSSAYKYAMVPLLHLYQDMLDAGICPEQARMVLPQSMMTEWIWSGTLFAIAKMYNLRIDSHTQYETRIVAKLIGEKMAELYPVSWKALTNGE